MLGDPITKHRSGIPAVVLADDCEKTAVGVLVVVLLAIDPFQALAIIFHNGGRIIAAIDHAEKKLFIGIRAVKEALVPCATGVGRS